MYKFKQIERLIEREVPKVPLPPELGDGPEWKTSNRGDGKRKFRPKGKFRGNNQRRNKK